jgi:hypothetical protein
MTRKEFKRRWESDDYGGGLTFEDVAKCAKDWGIYQRPMLRQMDEVLIKVLRAAGVGGKQSWAN